MNQKDEQIHSKLTPLLILIALNFTY